MASDMIRNFFSRNLNRGENTEENLNNTELEFHGPFPIDNSLNGLCMGEPKDILNCSLVCKSWCNIAKSNNLWHTIYNIREYPKKAKNLPCNGQEEFKHWNIVLNGGNQLAIEDPPIGCDPLPEGIPDFNGYTSCFVTSYHSCSKYQKIDLASKRLLRYIVKKYKPVLYLSEWYSARLDCASVYLLAVRCDTKDKKWSPDHSRDQTRFNHTQNQPDIMETTTPFYSKAKKDEMLAGPTWKKKLDLPSKRLLLYIIKSYKPTLYLSEWYSARYDCTATYLLAVRCDTKEKKWSPPPLNSYMQLRNNPDIMETGETTTPFYVKAKKHQIPAGITWKKMELTTNNYPVDLDSLYFCHEGKDCQFWRGHYGSKMAGGVIKFLFESIEPSAEDIIDDMEEVV